MCIKGNSKLFHAPNEIETLEPVTRYVWSEAGKEKFHKYISTPHFKGQCTNIIKSKANNPNKLVEDFNHIMNEAARASLELKKAGNNNRLSMKNMGNRKKFDFNKEVQSSKKRLKAASRKLAQDNLSQSKRLAFLKAKKEHRKTVSKIKNREKINYVNKLVGIEKSNPNSFWRSLKKLISKDNKENNANNVKSSDWVNHFRTLLNIKSDNFDQQYLDYVRQTLPLMERLTGEDSLLEKSFTEKDISECASSLQNNKAVCRGTRLLVRYCAAIWNCFCLASL